MFDVQGIVGFWHFDEPQWTGATSEVRDETGVNHGTAYGGATTTSDAKYGRAGYFDGVDDYVKVPDSNSLDVTDEITIEAWVKPEGDFSDLSYPTIVRKTGAYSLRYSHGNGSLVGLLWIGEDMVATYSLTNAWDTTKWTHFIFVYDGEYLRLYRDGIEAVTPRPWTGSINVVANDLGIGANGEGNLHLRGFVDEVRIYNRAISPTEVQILSKNYMQKMGSYFNVRKYVTPAPVVIV